MGRNYLGVNLHHSLKVVQVLVNVAEPTQKAGEILVRLGCAPTASRAGINMPQGEFISCRECNYL